MEQEYDLVKFIDGELELDITVSPYEETIWMSANQMACLFRKDCKTIRKHINNIFKDEELNYDNNTQKMRVDGVKQLVCMYSLDVIISVGYRVKSIVGVKFRIWANQILKGYLLRGYVINPRRVVVSNENYIELKNEVISINNRLLKLEDKVLDKEYGFNKIFYNGQFYDAYAIIQKIFESATKEIIIIDNYLDRTILDRLVVKKKNVKVIIYTNKSTSKLIDSDIHAFNKQYSSLSVRYIKKVHDRYIIIDREKLYHIGHSIKDLGKKIFSISESNSDLINPLLCNI
ncbi:MAG: virulence RhuM family protein [Bacilli bacterium]|nr:virulence RhuM family protein [Bacilli bacterium]